MNAQQPNHVFKSGFKLTVGYFRNPLYRNSLFLIADSAVTAGLGFFFWMVVARFYNTVDVGYGSATLSAIFLIATLSLLGSNTALIRFLPKAEKPLDMINSCLTLSSIISLVIAVVFIIGLDIWSPALSFIKQDVIYSSAFILFTVVATLSNILDAVFMAKRRADFVLLMDSTYSMLKIPLPALLVLFFHSFGIASATGVAMAIAVALGLFLFVPKTHKNYKPLPTLNKSVLGNLWRYSAGNYLSSIFSSASAWVLPILIVNVMGSQQNAYFYITWLLASLLSAIPIATSSSLFVEGSHFDEDLWLNTGRTLKFTYLLLIPAIVILLLWGNQILTLFGAEYAIHGSALLRIMAVSSLFVGINSIYNTILRIENRIKEVLVISAFQAIAVLTVSFFIAPKVGIIGIGYAWFGAQAVVSLYVIIMMIKHNRLRLKKTGQTMD